MKNILYNHNINQIVDKNLDINNSTNVIEKVLKKRREKKLIK